MSIFSTVSQTDSGVYSSFARQSDSTTSTNDQNRDQFLTLLITQLQNQDPMNPMENAELTSQLAQMSMVDGIERVNTMFSQLLSQQDQMQGWIATSMVGRGVLVEGKGIVLTEEGAIGGFELAEPADSVVLTITDSSGNEVARLEMTDLEAGSHNYVWDGTGLDGSKVAEGGYTVSVKATTGDQEVKAGTLQFGVVTSAIKGSQSTDLQVGALGIFSLDDIRQVL